MLTVINTDLRPWIATGQRGPTAKAAQSETLDMIYLQELSVVLQQIRSVLSQLDFSRTPWLRGCGRCSNLSWTLYEGPTYPSACCSALIQTQSGEDAKIHFRIEWMERLPPEPQTTNAKRKTENRKRAVILFCPHFSFPTDLLHSAWFCSCHGYYLDTKI